ncbi:olfactory receptor 63, partial [Danaus plexippus plexippus]
MHQTLSIMIGAVLNISKDSLVTTLLAQTRCRLGLVGLALTTVCSGLLPEQHQRALRAAEVLQECFSVPTFAQFSVSLIIICVTAFQVLSVMGLVTGGKMLGTPAIKKAIVLEQKMLEVQKEK